MKWKLAGSFTVSLILAMSAYAAPHSSASAKNAGERQIRIRIYNYAQVDSGDLVNAERITDDILHQAGVEAVWMECSAGDIPAKDTACKIPFGPMDVRLNLLPQSMAARFELGADKFGVALENAEGVAWIFCDLVRDAAAKEKLTRSVLLGTVISHELGHLLLSTNSHSPFGLMKAKWSGKELLAVEHRAMYFSSSENKKIQQAVIARQQSAVDESQSANPRPLNIDSESNASRDGIQSDKSIDHSGSSSW